MDPDFAALLLHAPAEGAQTCLVVAVVWAFALGVATAGAFHHTLLLHFRPEHARRLVAGAEGNLAPTLGVGAPPTTALTLVGGLLRHAFTRRPRG